MFKRRSRAERTYWVNDARVQQAMRSARTEALALCAARDETKGTGGRRAAPEAVARCSSVASSLGAFGERSDLAERPTCRREERASYVRPSGATVKAANDE